MLAIFDMDNTLVGTDTTTLWNEYMASQLGWVDYDEFMKKDSWFLSEYHKGSVSMQDYAQFCIEPLIGKSVTQVTQQVEKFVQTKIPPFIYQESYTQIQHYRQLGYTILIISANLDYLVKSIANIFEVDNVLCIDLETDNNTYTGQTTGILPFREGKISKLQTWLLEHNETLDHSLFFSDSQNDIPLLSIVSQPYVVNPDPVLLKHAQNKQWPILNWSFNF